MSFAVDTHFHIWDLQRYSYPWPTEDLRQIYRNFTIDDYIEELKPTPVKYSVFVHVLNKMPEEAKWVMDLAKQYPVIKGVVAGLDLTDPNLGSVIDELRSSPIFVGCRHILHFEEDDWITRDDVLAGLEILQDKNVPFDLVLRPPNMKYIPTVAEKLPKLRMVVDHLAKPLIKDQVMEGWKENLERIAEYPNIFCKISGMVVEADLENWKTSDFVPFVNHTLNVFGTDRCMFGSDWPVCCRANANYSQVFRLAEELLSALSAEEKEKVFCSNAVRFYNLQI